MDEIEQVIARGKRIALLLNDEDVKAVFAEMEAQHISEIRKAPSSAHVERPWMALRELDELQKRFRIVVERGQSAQADLDRTQKRSQ